jgi:hypothetical protein
LNEDRNTFEPHGDKQWELISSDSDVTLAATGTQWGKSQSGSLWLKRQTHIFTDPSDNFILAAPTYKIMNQSMIPYFLHYMTGLGTYNKSEALFEIKRGGKVWCRTEKDPDSVVGIPRVKAGWLDEVGKMKLYFWQNYQARSAAIGARSLLTTSPYSRNWVYKDLVKPKLAGGLPDLTYIKAASWENPYHSLHDPEKRAKMRASMDARRFDMLFGGEWGQMIGLVYDCFDDVENQVEPFQLPPGTKFYGGIDWGYSPDPFCLKIRAITPEGQHYSVSEFYKTGQTVSDIVQICKQKKQIFGILNFFCDPSQPGYIEELNRNGIPATPADNDILRGIALHYELIKTRKYKLFKGQNAHTLDEYEVYHYPEPDDLGPDDNEKVTKPVDQNNHACDTDRYITIMTYRSNIRTIPKVPMENNRKHETFEQRMVRLTKTKSSSGGTENW